MSATEDKAIPQLVIRTDEIVTGTLKWISQLSA